MDVVAFVDEGLGNSSYLVDVGGGDAIVVDPSRDPRPYFRAAGVCGLRISHVVETHLHADFISGSRELGATIVAAADADLDFGYHGVHDDDELEVGGGLTLRALATPGHTPEHVSFVLSDCSRTLALFSGGALIVGGVARTDLVSSDATEALTRAAYRSARDRLGALSDDVAVYPTHGAGSFCSTATGSDRVTTIGRERETNAAFVEDCEDTFVKRMVDAFGSFPSYFLRLRRVNRRGPKVYGDEVPTLRPIDVAACEGAVIVDARPFVHYADEHITGSLSIELRPAFATWLGWLVPGDSSLVFVVDPDQDVDDLVRECLKVGYEDLRGTVTVEAWKASGGGGAKIGVVSPRDVDGCIVDIRQRVELAQGRIPGAVHAELAQIASAELPDGPLTLHCGHGERAMTAASVLERSGRDGLAMMIGGPAEWSAETGRALV